jgi:hypothetical protein
MKRLFFAVAILAISVSFGQNTFPATGNVGIGTQTPSAILQIGSGIGNLHYGNNGVLIKFNNGDRSLLELHSPDGKNRLVFQSLSNASYLSSLDQKALLLQDLGGNVGIGSSNPDEKLTVKGKIHTQEVRVDLLVPADYVFEKYYTGASTLKADYVMPSLAEVEKYTKANNHLPNVPSAQEIKDKGLQLGEMSNVLLQKVEELTLYIIEQNKKIEALEAKVNSK